MVGLEVEKDRDTWSQLVDVLELEARQLAHDPRIPVERFVEARQGTSDIARNHHRLSCCTKHRPEQLAGRRLPVRAGHADEGISQQTKAELDLAPDRNTARACSRRQRRFSGHARALDEQLDVLQQAFLLSPRVDFDAGLGKPPDLDVGGAVDADGGDAASRERQRGSLAGPRKADYERPTWKPHGLRAATASRPRTAATLTAANPASVKSRSTSRASKFNTSPVGSSSPAAT